MSIDPQRLAGELEFLRKNRAARHPRLLERVGPQLRQVCQVGHEDSSLAVREKLERTLSSLLAGEARELRLALLAALGLHAQADHRLLTHRVQWLAAQLVCDERTARRRVEEAFALVVLNAHQKDRGELIADEAFGHLAWRVRRFKTTYRLDTPSPEAVEHRTIMALRAGLTQITYPFSLYRPDGDSSQDREVELETRSGVRLTRTDRPIPGHFRFHLELPHALNVGDEHEYSLVVRAPIGQRMVPQYIYTPVQACEIFDLTIQFELTHPPRLVWRVDAALPIMVEHAEPIGSQLTVGSQGEVRAMFHDLRVGLGYGLKWLHA